MVCNQKIWLCQISGILQFSINMMPHCKSMLQCHPKIEEMRFINHWKVFFLYTIDSCTKNMTQVNCKFLIMKSSNKYWFFLNCILSHYLAHEITKEFWKNSHFENMRTDFLLRCQNTLWWNTPEKMHFQE